MIKAVSVFCQLPMLLNVVVIATAQRGPTQGYPKDSVSTLLTRAGDLKDLTLDETEAIARIKLAILNPRVQAKFPDLQVVIDRSFESRPYRTVTGRESSVRADTVIVKLVRNSEVLTTRSWSANFGPITQSTVLHPSVRAQELLTTFFGLLSQNDLAQLARSQIPEIRLSAAANITDRAQLERLARDNVPEVGAVARDKIA